MEGSPVGVAGLRGEGDLAGEDGGDDPDILDEGYAGLSLRAVADEAGILQGNLTHHYASRDLLIEAVFESLIERYRVQFREMVARAQGGTTPVRDMVEWLLEDAMQSPTAPVFLQLWSMAVHMPRIAEGMARLYDNAVDAFVAAVGLPPHAPGVPKVRNALYLLGTVIEGSSAVFWTRDHSGEAFREVKALAVETLGDLIEREVAAARGNAG